MRGPLPRFEADEFAAAFVAANKPSAKTRRMDYIAKVERETDPERKLHLLKAEEDYGPGGRYADCIGGGVRSPRRRRVVIALWREPN